VGASPASQAEEKDSKAEVYKTIAKMQAGKKEKQKLQAHIREIMKAEKE
jgi:hypothetical protein